MAAFGDVTLAVNCAADGVTFRCGTVQDYGNSSGTAGHGFNLASGRRVEIGTDVDITARAGSSASGHRKIYASSSSGDIRYDARKFPPGTDTEELSVRYGLDQIVASNNASISAGQTSYLMPYTGAMSATQTDVRTKVAGRINLCELRAESVVLPGGSNTYVITLVQNGTDTALSVTLNNANSASSVDTAHEIQFEPGDTYSFKVVSSGTASTIPANQLKITVGARR